MAAYSPTHLIQQLWQVRGCNVLGNVLVEHGHALVGHGQYVCIYVCMHACIHMYIHAKIHRYIDTSAHRYIDTYMHTYIHTYIRTHKQAYIHTCTHACKNRIRVYIHTNEHDRYTLPLSPGVRTDLGFRGLGFGV